MRSSLADEDKNSGDTEGVPVHANAGAMPGEIPGMQPFERWLDRKLKSVYGAVLEEPIPQDLINLLKQKLDNRP